VISVIPGASFKKAELKTFLQFHREGEEPLRDDEITILNGVLSLNDRKASEIMTHIKDVLCLPSDHVLDHAALDHILLSGFSRIPVYEPGQKENFVGMLLVKRVRLCGVQLWPWYSKRARLVY
jgi:metal transporter CNNM